MRSEHIVYYVHTGRTVIFGTLRPQQWDPSSAGINCDFLRQIATQRVNWLRWYLDYISLVLAQCGKHQERFLSWSYRHSPIRFRETLSLDFFVKRQRIWLFWSLLKKMMAFLITKAVKRFKQHEKKFESKSGLPLWSTPPLFQFIPQVWRDFEILIQCFLHEWGWLRDLRSVDSARSAPEAWNQTLVLGTELFLVGQTKLNLEGSSLKNIVIKIKYCNIIVLFIYQSQFECWGFLNSKNFHGFL